MTDTQPKSMRTFFIIWSGQLISIIGSGLTGFALGVWIYQQTGNVTPFAMTALSGTIPNLVLAPLAGSLVDRWNRRIVMIAADTVAALLTFAGFLLLLSGQLAVWHIYVISAVGSIAGVFQRPAYMASITMLVPKEQIGRASGMMQMGQAIGNLVSPLLAGFLLLAIKMEGIIIIDFMTFFFAVGALLLVRIPQPESTTAGDEKKSVWQDALFGLKWLRQHPALLSLLFYFATVNFTLAMAMVMVTPMVLTFADTAVVGVMQSIIGVAMLAGSITMSTWGGTKRKMYSVYAGILLIGIGMVITGLQASVWVIGVGMFITLFSVPFASAASQAIWQVKVPADIQGRVFSIRSMLGSIMSPLALILVGPLVDGVLEKAMADGGQLASTAGQVIGTGAGRGMGLAIVILGLLCIASTVAAFFVPRIRQLELTIPDAMVDMPGQAVSAAK